MLQPSLTLQHLQQPDGARRGLPTCSWGPAGQVIVQREEEEDESSAVAGKEKLVRVLGIAAMPQQLPWVSGLVTCLPLSGCLSIILQLPVSLQLQPREKSKQTTAETKEQVQSKCEGLRSSASTQPPTPPEKRREQEERDREKHNEVTSSWDTSGQNMLPS